MNASTKSPTHQEGDITFQTGKTTTRAGAPARGRVNLKQVLQAPFRRDGVFVAIIKHPDDGSYLAEVPLWVAKAGECVDLTVVFETHTLHPKE